MVNDHRRVNPVCQDTLRIDPFIEKKRLIVMNEVKSTYETNKDILLAQCYSENFSYYYTKNSTVFPPTLHITSVSKKQLDSSRK